MLLFAALKKMREFERQQLPFIRSLIDYDLIIEIGYAQEQKKPLTPKPLFLMSLGPATTVRRRLARLIEDGVVRRRQDDGDRRFSILTLSPGSLKLLGKYGALISEMSVA